MIRNSHGYTLVEVMMSTLLLSLIFTSVYMVTDQAFDIYHTDKAYTGLNDGAKQMIRTIGREISQTNPESSASRISISTDGNSNTIVDFQIPVDWDSDGDVVTSSLSPDVEWGAHTALGDISTATLGSWTRYWVNSDSQLVRSITSTSGGAVQTDTDQILVQDVANFSVTQDDDYVDVALALTDSDAETERDVTATFTHRTLLRNEVD